jgi:hypothetical protein
MIDLLFWLLALSYLAENINLKQPVTKTAGNQNNHAYGRQALNPNN